MVMAFSKLIIPNILINELTMISIYFITNIKLFLITLPLMTTWYIKVKSNISLLYTFHQFKVHSNKSLAGAITPRGYSEQSMTPSHFNISRVLEPAIVQPKNGLSFDLKK